MTGLEECASPPGSPVVSGLAVEPQAGQGHVILTSIYMLELLASSLQVERLR